ncbi:MAG TPA: hypothetical protein VNO50_19540 [Pyrinomonadaceae bacterium]|nr:hypothetical protein [Pyrinomonadaceae bacterium]
MSRILATSILILITASMVFAQSKNRNRAWLNGTWEGTGYQIDTNNTWTMQLTVKGNRYKIEYPSLNCEGRWRPIRITRTTARFREILTSGADVCADKGTVVIQRLSHRQIAFRYTNQGEADVTSSSILNRKK